MDNKYLEKFIDILLLQRYSDKSIRTYKFHISFFLKVSVKYSPEEITQKQLEDFIFWL
ncbi:phage integrase N-terminal SAM-like domain-containing protein [Chryseobacterium oryctis]|uniref:Phage integrase N-terminal SAM-like domain-containing protein n=1 Tax=Chryseobacterium oryctis TaxID=2952618 RepID=A0ABT3HPJ9_9FLAO|nr:phage integrase N-terminal SAM-like domain-containing protein [Chryseobacterium oryctis]MCW3161715.1 phage integrase N-terminal SAM-like domain-containing protein [Chryseobacterium oryctis]